MKLTQLFEAIDLDGDGNLSRVDLHGAARALGWGWPEAPVFAVLDLFCARGPLSRQDFEDRMEQLTAGGPYGEVLLHSPAPTRFRAEAAEAPVPEDPVEVLARVVSDEVAAGYGSLLVTLDRVEIDSERAALLIIDPQRSFTGGSWMRSMGPRGEQQVAPIRRAFAACGRLLSSAAPSRTVFTRCPFPPDSYGWDERVAPALPEEQVYFVKPGNSALWPPTNGFAAWAYGLAEAGVTTLVMGGCTLNSCMRVTAIDTRRRLEDTGVSVLVDLDLCGARADNYVPSPEWGGRSSVESAIRQMQDAGVQVVAQLNSPSRPGPNF